MSLRETVMRTMREEIMRLTGERGTARRELAEQVAALAAVTAELAASRRALAEEAKLVKRITALAWQLQLVLRQRASGTIGHLLSERELATYREIFPGHGE
jgi:uncharacterized protein (DUF2252 family)